MRKITRLSVGAVMVAGIGMLPWLTTSSFVWNPPHVKPTLTATRAAFTIPTGPSGQWTLKLWTLPVPTTQVGQTSGTSGSGTLTLPVPQTASCEFQVDVRFEATGATTSSWYSGLIATVPGCGQSGTGQRYTPGYWKTHGSVTATLLPQTLGTYVVSTSTQSTDGFNAMKCSDAINCLAGHLLAAELDVANGSSICIRGVIFQANSLLTTVGYTGPGSDTVTTAQHDAAISLATTLDDYTTTRLARAAEPQAFQKVALRAGSPRPGLRSS